MVSDLIYSLGLDAKAILLITPKSVFAAQIFLMTFTPIFQLLFYIFVRYLTDTQDSTYSEQKSSSSLLQNTRSLVHYLREWCHHANSCPSKKRKLSPLTALSPLLSTCKKGPKFCGLCLLNLSQIHSLFPIPTPTSISISFYLPEFCKSITMNFFASSLPFLRFTVIHSSHCNKKLFPPKLQTWI